MQRKKIHMLVLAGGFLAGGMIFGSSNAEAGATAEMLANTCAGCHGTNGVSGGPAMPSIAGMKAKYLEQIMADFKSGDRPSTIMGRIAKGYDAKQTAAMAKFFAAQGWQDAMSAHQSKNRTMIDAKKVKAGKKYAKKAKCGKCHEDDGVFQDEDTPRMAGQWVDYLIFKMQDLKNKHLDVPQEKKMRRGIDALSAAELEAVAHFYANVKGAK